MKAQKSAPHCTYAAPSLLARLRVNKAGNTIAMTAAAIFPLAGMVGGAVDMSRIYAVKSRLQSACDSGSLAGRRTQAGGSWSANSNAAATQALRTFDLNFTAGSFGSTGVTRSYIENAGVVTGSASADVPMTLMKIFNQPTYKVTVSCESQMRIPNTDVMFVLDTTGSMGWAIPGDPSGTSKINGLKTAVKCFYQELAKRNLGELCGNPSGWVAPNTGVGNAVQLRFGFVPYTTNVNVGKLLPPSMFADQWNYQSRVVTTTLEWRPSVIGAESAPVYGIPSGGPSWSNKTYSGPTSVSGFPTTVTNQGANCNNLNSNALPGRQDTQQGATNGPNFQSRETVVYPDSLQTTNYSTSKIFISRDYRYVRTSSSNGGTCTLYISNNSRQWTQTTLSQTTRGVAWTQEPIPSYTYEQVQQNISGLKNNQSWNNSVQLPLGDLTRYTQVTDANGSTFRRYSASVDQNQTVNWDGCIEERQTFRNTDGNATDDWIGYTYPNSHAASDPLAPAYDMDIDMAPAAGRPETYWAPALEEAAWARVDSGSNWTTSPVNTDQELDRNFSYSCPREGRLLQVWSNPNDFKSYVDSLFAGGNTYHDIGLIWGWRLLSSTGIMASQNALTPSGGSIQRHLIFMTDGDTVTDDQNYTAYGINWWDGRQVADSNNLTDATNARMDALCRAMKNTNITVWVVSYGSTVSSSARTRLRNCATDTSKFFDATSTASLRTAFSSIAQQISDLRLTN